MPLVLFSRIIDAVTVEKKVQSHEYAFASHNKNDFLVNTKAASISLIFTFEKKEFTPLEWNNLLYAIDNAKAPLGEHQEEPLPSKDLKVLIAHLEKLNQDHGHPEPTADTKTFELHFQSDNVPLSLFAHVVDGVEQLYRYYRAHPASGHFSAVIDTLKGSIPFFEHIEHEIKNLKK